MRIAAFALSLALVAGSLPAPSRARADTFEAPTEVTARLNGSFHFVCTFRKGEGTGLVAGVQYYGTSNCLDQFFGDCFCFPGCAIEPGDSIRVEIAGGLTDPGLPGGMDVVVSLCSGGGGRASVTILPYEAIAGADGLPAARDARLWNEPNPFSTRTTFHYHLPEPGAVRLTLHDLAGRRVAQLVDEVQAAGAHEVPWNAGGAVPARGGALFARLTTAGRTHTRTLVLIR